ncbi:hypothetical protein JHD48_04305 [Sulfurimonas sp. SAG-AH-194-I05]|nr:hypothetical protein [Sulfurimonas sp. SAG-AH-194-I05]MDF1874951.1 hypothetical protein [Sulfurimonas sp. SAG-AH-194-I05]
MKKYNYIILFILILITISVSTYFFYLDIIYSDKLVKKDVESLYKLKRTAGRPIVVYANAEELDAKVYDYNQIIIELNLDAMVFAENKLLKIQGNIHNGFSYILLKRLLNIIKNDEVNVLTTCIGKDCTSDNYGFLIKIRPYSLKLK